eukprot:jgi/Tetstr1/423746/TSEL_014378.t1
MEDEKAAKRPRGRAAGGAMPGGSQAGAAGHLADVEAAAQRFKEAVQGAEEDGPGLEAALRSFVEAQDALGAEVAGGAEGQAEGGEDGLSRERAAWANRCRTTDSLITGLRSICNTLRTEIDTQRAAPAAKLSSYPGTGEELAKEVVAYAHKISYTTFAPPSGSQACFRPPAPQDWQLMRSKLHAHARKMAALEASQRAEQAAAAPALAAARASSVAEAAGKVEPAGQGQSAAVPAMPPGWKPGDPLPDIIPQMPPGWKPGDPLPELDAPLPAHPASALPTAVPAQAVAAAPSPPEAPDLGLFLNPEMVYDDDEYVSESEDSESDDEE